MLIQPSVCLSMCNSMPDAAAVWWLIWSQGMLLTDTVHLRLRHALVTISMIFYGCNYSSIVKYVSTSLGSILFSYVKSSCLWTCYLNAEYMSKHFIKWWVSAARWNIWQLGIKTLPRTLIILIIDCRQLIVEYHSTWLTAPYRWLDSKDTYFHC